MKFSKTFAVSIKTEDVTTAGTTEDYYTLAQVLANAGTKMSDFENTDAAVKAAMHLQEVNMQEHGWSLEDYPNNVDNVFPQFTKMYMVNSLGKTKTSSSTTEKKLGGQANVGTVGQLSKAKNFLEGLGWEPEALEDGSGGATIANVKFEELKKQVELLKKS